MDDDSKKVPLVFIVQTTCAKAIWSSFYLSEMNRDLIQLDLSNLNAHDVNLHARFNYSERNHVGTAINRMPQAICFRSIVN